MPSEKGKGIDNPQEFHSFDMLLRYSNNQMGMSYFKFVPLEGQSKNLGTCVFDTQIEGTQILYVDWDNAVIEKLFVTLHYDNTTKDRKTYYKMEDMAFVFKDYEFTGTHWRNLNVEYMEVEDPRVAIFRVQTVLHACHFKNIVIKSDESAYDDYWVAMKGENFCPFGYRANFSKCVVNWHSENIAPRMPMVELYDTQFNLDYKWTLQSNIRNNGIFCRCRKVMDSYGFNVGTYSWNSIITGTIDLSKSQSLDSFGLVRPATNSDISTFGNEGVPGICRGDGGLRHNQSLTINLKIINGPHSKVEHELYEFSQIYYNTDLERYQLGVYGVTTTELVYVIDNGDGYEGQAQDAVYDRYVARPYTRYQLRNPDWLDDMGYNYLPDDGERYPIIGSEFVSSHPSSTGKDFLLWPQTDDTFIKRKNPVVNSQYPFLPFNIYPVKQMPENNGNVTQSPYVCIYDMHTPQDRFDDHGLAVLCPTQCRIIEELNGGYYLTMTHPLDKDNKYQYILEWNIIKALGQLFVIQKVEEVAQGNSRYVTCYAEHITYTLNERWLYPPFTVAGYTAQTLIDSIMAQSWDNASDWRWTYVFTVTSDMSAEQYYDDWHDVMDGATPYEMLIGANGLVSRLGGELYRDNFEMSINSRMEDALENAFAIKVGYNVTGMKRTVDVSTFASYIKAYPVINGEFHGEDGEWFAVAWDPSTLPRAYPREIIRSIKIAYDFEADIDRLGRDCMAYFNQVCAPIVSYEFNIVDLRRNPDYAEFANNYRFKVGDTGKIWDERLKAWNVVMVSRTEKDGITGDTTKVVIGNTRSFTRPSSYNPLVPNPYVIDAAIITDGELPLEFDSNGEFLIDWVIYGAEGGVGETVNAFDAADWVAVTNTHVVSSFVGMAGGTIEAVTDGLRITVSGTMQTAQTLSANYPMNQLETPITVTQGKTYTLSWEQDVSRPTTFVEIYNNRTKIAATTSENQRSLTFTAPSNTIALMFTFANCDNPSYPRSVTYTNMVLSDGSYFIPVQVISGLSSRTVTIPIQSKLYANMSIGKKDTGVEIPTFNGHNMIICGTTVNPSHMKIEYKQPIETNETEE